MTIRFAGTSQCWRSALLGLVTLAACQGSAPTSATAPPDATAVTMSIVSGNTQSAAVNTNVAAPLRVRVLSHSGRPVPDFVVNFVVTFGGGHVFGGAEQTDALGYAQDMWTLGPRLGPQTLDVRSVDAHTGQAITYGHFTATGLPPHNIQVVFGNSVGIAVMNADGTDIKQVTGPCNNCDLDEFPVLARDHLHVVFVSSRFGLSPSVSYATIGGVILHNFELAAMEAPDQAPQISPDGTRIAVNADQPEAAGTFISVFDTAGNDIADLGGASGCGCFHNPSFSADGTKLVLESTLDVGGLGGTPDIYTVNFAGSSLDSASITRLTFNGGTSPSWSPDGRHIAFTHAGDTYVMDPDGNNQRAITTGGQGVGFVSWSPDSQLMGSSSGLMNADGTHLVRINGGAEGQFAWR